MFQDIKCRAAEPAVGRIIALAAVDGSPAGVAAEAEKYMKSNKLYLCGWVEDDQILGICGYEVHPAKAEVHLIAVAEQRQHEGIGTAMLYALQAMYHLPLELETVEEAVGFYRKLGFTATPFPDAAFGVKYTCFLPCQKEE
ncbi:MAG: GNAT family N-acetyltransferase [Oscillospiraceae bacterium]|jgi:ribosomal protein S18 acetylase RimI-like enzyme|nr:GNAT family N-acetyltransferase [Oscillospiraceae bacterium]